MNIPDNPPYEATHYSNTPEWGHGGFWLIDNGAEILVKSVDYAHLEECSWLRLGKGLIWDEAVPIPQLTDLENE